MTLPCCTLSLDHADSSGLHGLKEIIFEKGKILQLLIQEDFVRVLGLPPPPGLPGPVPLPM